MEPKKLDTIFEYIKQKETAYKLPIRLNDSWEWSMAKHIKLTYLYNNSQLETVKDDFKPVKNITRPILNLQHRAEDIDVKDIQIWVNNEDKYHLSFLVKKYHDDVFIPKYDIDTYLDDLNIERIDFGAGLSKKLYGPCPEVVALQSIIFCDQRDLMAAPIGIEHYMGPDEFLSMADNGWGDEKNGATATLEEALELWRKNDENANKDIRVIEVHGNLPLRYASDKETSNKYQYQIYIVCFYVKENGEKQGIILYTAPEKNPFKLTKRDKVYGRAVGFGGAEELFEPQVWINYDMIRIQNMLDAAAITLLKTTDPAVTQRQKVRDMDNLEVIDLAPGTDISQVDTYPRNMALFEKSIGEWEAHAQQMGAANDAIQGKQPTAGTPFKLQELVTQESHSLHDYRRGQYAKHLEEIYKDWIIPYIEKEIVNGAKFLSELSFDELQFVSQKVIEYESKKAQKEFVLNNGGVAMTPEQVKAFEAKTSELFKKKGSKHFIEILKGEFKDTELAAKVNIAGKQKDLAGRVDKLTNVFRAILSNPYMLQAPPIAKLFNQIIEASGLDPIDLSNFNVPPMPTRRMTESIDIKDLQPNERTEMLKQAGIDVQPTQPPLASPVQAQPQLASPR